MPQISPKPLNGFAQNSHGRRVWSLDRTISRSKVKVTRDKKRAVHSHNSPERGTKRVFRVNLAQIRSAIPEIFHTQIKNKRTRAKDVYQANTARKAAEITPGSDGMERARSK